MKRMDGSGDDGGKTGAMCDFKGDVDALFGADAA